VFDTIQTDLKNPPPEKAGFFYVNFSDMAYYNSDTVLWLNGELVRASEAKMDLYSQSLHYGYAVFEGIRSYRTSSGQTRIFKPLEHYTRLETSAKALNMPYGWDRDVLIRATYDVLAANKLQDAYIRPIVYAPANMSFNKNEVSHLAIEVWEMQPFLGDKLLKVMRSSFQRPNPRGFRIHAKAAGHYVNSILASQEAKAAGYDEALLEDMNGFIAEGPGANVFFEKNGELYTPAGGNILEGITRATVLEICKEMNIPVHIKACSYEELKQADAAFFCGTAAEVIGWQRIDDYTFPKPWNETLSAGIQKAYKQRVVEDEFNEETVDTGAETERLRLKI
jgi:branched-chain amino acid aminotransferase